MSVRGNKGTCQSGQTNKINQALATKATLWRTFKGLDQLVDVVKEIRSSPASFLGWVRVRVSVTMLIKNTDSHPPLGAVYWTCILRVTDHTDSLVKSLFAAADSLKKKSLGSQTSPAVPPC